MADDCNICRILQDGAAEAITRQVSLVSKRDIARLRRDSVTIERLLPLIEEAKAERERALTQYRAHMATHRGKTAAAAE